MTSAITNILDQIATTTIAINTHTQGHFLSTGQLARLREEVDNLARSARADTPDSPGVGPNDAILGLVLQRRTELINRRRRVENRMLAATGTAEYNQHQADLANVTRQIAHLDSQLRG